MFFAATCPTGQKLIKKICMSFHAGPVNLDTAKQRCTFSGGKLAIPTNDFASTDFASEFATAFPSGNYLKSFSKDIQIMN